MDELSRIARDSETSMFNALERIAQGDQSEGNALASLFAPRSLRALEDFHSLMKGLAEERNKLDLVELIEQTVERTGYQKYLRDQTDRGEERLENLDEFKSSARDYIYLGIDDALTAFLESVSLVADIDSLEEKADAITLITLHQAKGLEYRAVFMVGMEEGLLPHMRSIDSGDPGELEEERRLCYVGVTRAKERLYLLRAFRRGFRGGSEPTMPSRFLMDIPQKLIEAPPKAEPSQKKMSAASSP